MTPGFTMWRKRCITPGTSICIRASTILRTRNPGYIPVKNLTSAIEADSDGHASSFVVLMLYVFFRSDENVEHQHGEREDVTIGTGPDLAI